MKPMHWLTKIMVFVSAVIFLATVTGVVYAVQKEDEDPPNLTRSSYCPAEPSRALTCQAAVEAVKDSLVAPATAQFPSCLSEANQYNIKTSAHGVTVDGHVDAQNARGATLRKTWHVEMLRLCVHGELALPVLSATIN